VACGFNDPVVLKMQYDELVSAAPMDAFIPASTPLEVFPRR
jgi:hypothetical protein